MNSINRRNKGTIEDVDFYATDPIAIDKPLQVESFDQNIWECAAGQGHLSNRLIEHGYTVLATDLYDHSNNSVVANITTGIDFLAHTHTFNGDIITNPPYNLALEFVEKAIALTKNKVAMFLKITFLESKKRREFFKKYPPTRIYVFTERVICAKNGDFENTRGSAVCYAWFVWTKGNKKNPTVYWI